MKKSKFSKYVLITAFLLGTFAGLEVQAVTHDEEILLRTGINIVRFDPKDDVTTGLKPLIEGTIPHVTQYLGESNPALQDAWKDAISRTLLLLANNAQRPTQKELDPVVERWSGIHENDENPVTLILLAQAMELALFNCRQIQHI